MKKLIFYTILFALALPLRAQTTLQQCIDDALANYPAIHKHRLLQATEDIEVAEANRMWLPRLSVYVQGAVQNINIALPEALTQMMTQMGESYEGMSRWQYKAGLDVTQTLWDGGAAASRRDVARAENRQREASLDVDLYAVRQHVESLYFGILLTREQRKQLDKTIQVLDANIARMQALIVNGAALQADADILEAQRLSLLQQQEQLSSSGKTLQSMLEYFVGHPVDADLKLPEVNNNYSPTNNRPELRLFDAAEALNKSRIDALKVSVMPKAALFAQSYYGYPGINMFEAMKSRTPSFNIVAGVKMSWNIDSFYTLGLSKRKLQNANEMIATDRETFLFNTEMQLKSQQNDINTFDSHLKTDEKIVALRQNVRRTAESQLENGVIDSSTLLAKINDEAQAALNATLHKIQYIQATYKLKYTLNQ